MRKAGAGLGWRGEGAWSIPGPHQAGSPLPAHSCLVPTASNRRTSDATAFRTHRSPFPPPRATLGAYWVGIRWLTFSGVRPRMLMNPQSARQLAKGYADHMYDRSTRVPLARSTASTQRAATERLTEVPMQGFAVHVAAGRLVSALPPASATVLRPSHWSAPLRQPIRTSRPTEWFSAVKEVRSPYPPPVNQVNGRTRCRNRRNRSNATV